MKKGFTLIELLAVITILAILLVLTTTTVSKIIKDNKTDMYNKQIESFVESAKNWALANPNEMPLLGESIKLTIGELTDEHFIKENVINPLTKEVFAREEYICILNVNSRYAYVYNGEC